VLEIENLKGEREDLRDRLREVEARERTGFLWASDKMTRIKEILEQVSDADVTILIHGESGVGKEVVARTTHDLSNRRENRFVKVNCAALPEELLESELFGYERGAFTGASSRKAGKFEVASGGTMFLDEIGEMSPKLQAKLLQVLQDGEFSRLGGKSDVRVDVRMITATNVDLEAAVASGRFREDLFYRLNVVTITIPPLRDRREEIPGLAEHFQKKYSVQYNKPAPAISPELSRLFMEFEWPGNVRQLENLIKRMVVLGSEAPIVRELEQPAVHFQHWPQAAAPASRPVIPPQYVPPPAAAARAAIQRPARCPTYSNTRCSGAGAGAMDNVSLERHLPHQARGAERELILRMLTRTRWNWKCPTSFRHSGLLYKIGRAFDKALSVVTIFRSRQRARYADAAGVRIVLMAK
jgi:two-component system response regulator AtoC